MERDFDFCVYGCGWKNAPHRTTSLVCEDVLRASVVPSWESVPSIFQSEFAMTPNGKSLPLLAVLCTMFVANAYGFLNTPLVLPYVEQRRTCPPRLSLPPQNDQDESGEVERKVAAIRRLMSALEELHDVDKAANRERRAREQRQGIILSRAPRATDSLTIIRERLERAVLQHEHLAEGNTSATVMWPPIPCDPASAADAENNVLILTGQKSSGGHSRARLSLGRSGHWVATDSNDAWLLSTLIWNWRHARQFKAYVVGSRLHHTQ